MSRQQVIRGENSLHKAVELIKDAGYSKVFVVCGRHFKESMHGDIFGSMDVDYWIKRGSNVTTVEMKEAADAFDRAGETALLAVGGGSVMDLAKTLTRRRNGKNLLFIAAPTTMGSGSEATHFAVVYEEGRKSSLVNPSFLPTVVILDPALGASLSPYLIAASGMDVIAQAIESFWSKSASDQSKSHSRTAIKEWKSSFPEIINHNTNTLRASMLEAAYESGQAIALTRTTGPHAMSYYLTSNHGVAHGHAVGMLLPMFFHYNYAEGEVCQLLGAKDATEAIGLLQHLMKQAGLATTLEQLNIDKTRIVDEWLNDVNEERFTNNPVSFNRQRLRELINEYL